MTTYETFVEVGYLSSGTLSRLADDQRYSAIDEYLFEWRQWILRQPRGKRWATWQDCHDEYQAVKIQKKEAC